MYHKSHRHGISYFPISKVNVLKMNNLHIQISHIYYSFKHQCHAWKLFQTYDCIACNVFHSSSWLRWHQITQAAGPHFLPHSPRIHNPFQATIFFWTFHHCYYSTLHSMLRILIRLDILQLAIETSWIQIRFYITALIAQPFI